MGPPIEVMGGPPIDIEVMGADVTGMDGLGAAMDVIGMDGIGIDVTTGIGGATGIGIGIGLTGSAGALPATGRYDGVFKRRSSSCNASMYAACCLCDAINAFKSGPAYAN